LYLFVSQQLILRNALIDEKANFVIKWSGRAEMTSRNRFSDPGVLLFVKSASQPKYFAVFNAMFKNRSLRGAIDQKYRRQSIQRAQLPNAGIDWQFFFVSLAPLKLQPSSIDCQHYGNLRRLMTSYTGNDVIMQSHPTCYI
jgi:hypothetical protein